MSDDAAAWQALADHAVALGKMSPAQRDAGFASDLAPDAPPPGQRGADGRFAGAPAPKQAESRQVQEIKAMADSLVLHQRLTRTQADQMLAADLRTLEKGAMDPATVSDEEIDGMVDAVNADQAAKRLPDDPLAEHDLDPVFDRPADPSLYKLPPAKSEKLDVPTMQAIQKLAWQARLPQVIATDMFTIADGYLAGKELSDTEFKLLGQRTTAMLDQRYGAEMPKKLDQARRLVNEVMKKNPALLPLIGTGLGSDYRFVCQMIEHSARLYGGKT